jgi:hypothetical protein
LPPFVFYVGGVSALLGESPKMNFLPQVLNFLRFCIRHNLAPLAISGMVASFGLLGIAASRTMNHYGELMELVSVLVFLAGIVLAILFFLKLLLKPD